MKLLIALVFSAVLLFAEIAKVSSVVGDATIERLDEVIIVKIGTLVEKKDIIKTKSNSKVQLIFKDNTIVTLGKNSALDIHDYLYDPNNPKDSKTDLNFFKGAFKTITGKIGKINKQKFKLRTKNSTIGIRGTVILSNQNSTVCLKGGISVTSGGKTVLVDNGELTTIKNGQPTEPQSLTSQVLEVINEEIEPEEETSTSTSTQNDNNSSNEETTSHTETQSKESSSDEVSDSNSTESSTEEIKQEDTTVQASSEDSTKSDETISSSSTSSTETTSTSTLTQTADKTVEDSSQNTVVTVSYDLMGYALGGYIDGTSTSNSFSHTNDSLKAKRVEKILNIDTSLKRDYNSSNENITLALKKEFTSFDIVSKGAYKSHSNIGTIPFSYTVNGITLSGNYSVEADNTGEFFVVYYDGVRTNHASGSFTEFNELFVVGNNANTTNVDKSKIYIYKDFISMRIDKDSSGNFTDTDMKKETAYEYYNAHLNSVTHFNKQDFTKGAEEFIVGSSTSVKAYRNKYDFTYDFSSNTTNLTKYTSGSTDATIALKGTNLQGLVYDLSSSTTNKNYTTSGTNTVTTSSSNTGASFLDKTIDAKTTGTLSMKGYLSADVFGATYKRVTTSNLNLNVNRNTGTINGEATLGDTSSSSTNNGAELGFQGDISSNTSYYINDDLFGVVLKDSLSKYVFNSNSYTLSANSGYLIAFPDGGFDSNDNPIMLDDDSSWGYWTSKFNNGSNEIFISPYSTWVAGIQTSSSVVDSMLNNTTNQRYTFKGSVLGTVFTGSGKLENIKMDSSNSVTMNFDLGGGSNSMSGTIGFQTDSTSWDMQLSSNPSVAGHQLNNQGFKGTMSGLSNSSFEGKFYGDGSVKSVGGVFNATKTNNAGSNDIAQGVFKAVKK